MAYEPHTWVADELITHEKLNHMETGIAGSVPTERTVNNKSLGSNITLSASDVSAVPTSRTVNGRSLSSNITLTASDVNAVTTSRKINGQPLTSDINIETGGSGIGKSLAGQSVKPTLDTTVTASTGAEIFNDYRKREFSSYTSNGVVKTVVTSGNVASGEYSHAEGTRNTASGDASHVLGFNCIASGDKSFCGGLNSVASNVLSFAFGNEVTSSGGYQTVFGSRNVGSNSFRDALIIGSGGNTIDGNSTNSNCFRVTYTGVFASGAYNSSGADYAEMFEWADNNPTNEDRRGLFVTLDGERIRISKPGDENIIGIVSGNPTVLGDVYDDQWQGMYMTDVFGSPIWEDVEVPDQTMERPDPKNSGKTITEVVIPAHTEHRQKLNPNYDHTQKYKARTDRPEWAPVGLIGKLVAIDDGTCEPGGYCTVGYDDGVATSSVEDTRYYVMSRIDNTHIRVFIKAH